VLLEANSAASVEIAEVSEVVIEASVEIEEDSAEVVVASEEVILNVQDILKKVLTKDLEKEDHSTTEMIMIMALNKEEVVDSLTEVITETMNSKAVEEIMVALVEILLLNLKRVASEVVQEAASVEDIAVVQAEVDSEKVLRNVPIEVLL
jgi:hypothetical protein